VWTKTAVSHLALAKNQSEQVPAKLLTLAQQITDANSAIFDPAHQFRGCIPGIHEILRRQACSRPLVPDPEEDLSPGQDQEIDRVCASYPHLADDDFVKERLDECFAKVLLLATLFSASAFPGEPAVIESVQAKTGCYFKSRSCVEVLE